MTAAPRLDAYGWAGGSEFMLRFGTDAGPVVVAVLPLFEEANRTRAFVVTILQALARHGIAGALPDLPGQGESLSSPHGLSLGCIREGLAAAIARLRREARRVYAISVRSGALLDDVDALHGRWRLAPQTGGELLRELNRTRGAAAPPADILPAPGSMLLEIGGSLIDPELLADLGTDRPDDHAADAIRTVRLATDRRPADRHVDASPLWRRSEPTRDDALAALLADDVAAWIGRCEG